MKPAPPVIRTVFDIASGECCCFLACKRCIYKQVQTFGENLNIRKTCSGREAIAQFEPVGCGGEITNAQHCRAGVYLEALDWAPIANR